jgi:hypothetical protein
MGAVRQLGYHPTMEDARVLLENDSGNLLRAGPGTLHWSTRADDGCVWFHRGDRLTSVVRDLTLRNDRQEADDQWQLIPERPLGPESAAGLGAPHRALPAPARPPGDYLADLRRHGFTVLDQLMDPAAIARFKVDLARIRSRDHSDESPRDGHFWIMDAILWSPELARAISHPVALWIMEQYLGETGLHFCTQPIITVLKPAQDLIGTFPAGGWHSDYPYHPGVFPGDRWPSDPPLGVQFNICVDPFSAETGATQFLPGSHHRGQWPSATYNEEGTRMGEGIHTDVAQLIAPAGAALIYDSRTWHRACHELNTSGADRIAVLNAVAPAWVPPMIDKRPLSERFPSSPVPDALSERERADVERLCHAETAPRPEHAPALTPPKPRTPRKPQI